MILNEFFVVGGTVKEGVDCIKEQHARDYRVRFTDALYLARSAVSASWTWRRSSYSLGK